MTNATLLTPKDFTGQDTVVQALKDLHSFIAQEKATKGDWRISDIGGGDDYAPQPDGPTYPLQYVDLVMEGGGMLGLALVGYVYALEQAGIRFLRLGGTSAGAINTLLMAAAGPREEAATDWLITELANQDFYEFVDGDDGARDFTDDLLRPATQRKGLLGILAKVASTSELLTDGIRIVDNLRDDYGLHLGDKFKAWVTQLVEGRGIATIGELMQRRMAVPAGGLHRHLDGTGTGPAREPYESASLGRLAVVATDITTQTKVVFPEMAHLYWEAWEQVHPAELVRASMSIPLFFRPYECHGLPGAAAEEAKDAATAAPYRKAWANYGYTGPVPAKVLFMDGGIMSNFPIDLFHDATRKPEAPTLGVKLGIDRAAARPTESLPAVLGAMFDAARTQHDFEFIHNNPDYQHLVHCLNVDEFDWLDFRMKREDKLALFAVGVRGAVEFLKKFNWERYKTLRAANAVVVAQAAAMKAEAKAAS